MSEHADVVVVGGGIVGLATAYRLLEARPDLRLIILEREPSLAAHQTSHNSGVIHAGIYYAPGSLKARLCRDGKAALEAFCEAHAIPFERVGKLVVALAPAELPRLEALRERATANGVPGLEVVGPGRLRELEPHAAGIRALWSPTTGIVDYRRVALAYADEVRAGAQWWERHIVEVLTGLPPDAPAGSVPRPDYDPELRSLRQRELAKHEELAAAGQQVGLSTLKRLRARYEREGLLGVVDHRAARRPTPAGYADPRVVEITRQAIAEETDLIRPIGAWVLKTACMQNRAWQRQGIQRIPLAVNLSPRQFAEESLVHDIKSALADSGLEGSELELEITESMVMNDPEQAVNALRRLKDLGISVAIDDFGTGYSSLAYLKRFPIDSVKLDRSFVDDIPHDVDSIAIAQAIIAMAHTLRLKVVAEGVESEAQVSFLRGEGCDEIQGHYFSAARPANEISRIMRKTLRRGATVYRSGRRRMALV